MNYQRDSDGWLLIRGQEHDRYITEPVDIKLPCKPEKLRNPYTTVIQYLKNVSKRKYEEDYFCAQTFIEATRWIEKNYKHDKFFLYIDTFDPHEPWDPPKYFVDMYDPDYKGEEVYFLPEDPQQLKNLINENKEKGKELRNKILKFLYEVKTDEKIIKLWF